METSRTDEIRRLASAVMQQASEDSSSLHGTLLKTAALARLLDLPQKSQYFAAGAQLVEKQSLYVDGFDIYMKAACDPAVSVSSSNVHEHVSSALRSFDNAAERAAVFNNATKVMGKSREAARRCILFRHRGLRKVDFWTNGGVRLRAAACSD